MVEISEMSWSSCKKLHFTDREVAVAELAARGYTNGRIAKELVIAPKTAKRHLQNLTAKLNVTPEPGIVRRLVVVEHLRQMGLGRK